MVSDKDPTFRYSVRLPYQNEIFLRSLSRFCYFITIRLLSIDYGQTRVRHVSNAAITALKQCVLDLTKLKGLQQTVTTEELHCQQRRYHQQKDVVPARSRDEYVQHATFWLSTLANTALYNRTAEINTTKACRH